MKYTYSNNEEELVKKGWSGMKKMLDREMPTERKKPKAVWWCIGICLFAGMVAMAVWKEKNRQKIIPNPSVQEAIANWESHAISDEASLAIEGGNSGSDAAKSLAPERTAQSASGIMSVEEPVVTPVLEVEESPKIKSTPNRNPEEKAMKSSRLSSNGAIEALQQDNIGHPDIKSWSGQLTPQGEPSYSEKESHPSIEKYKPAALLSEQKLNFLTFIREESLPSRVNLPDEILIHPQRHHKRWQFGATVGAVTFELPKPGGIQAGITIDYHAGLRWGIRSGLQYRYERASKETQVFVAIPDTVFATATGDYTVLPVTIAGASQASYDVIIPLEATHWLQVPLLGFWAPWKKIRLYGGIQAGYLMQAYASNKAYSKYNDVFAVDQKSSAQKTLNQEVVRFTDRFLLDFQLGVGWKIGRWGEIGLSCNFPLGRNSSEANNTAVFSPEDLDNLYSPGVSTYDLINQNKKESGKSGSLTLSGTVFF